VRWVMMHPHLPQISPQTVVAAAQSILPSLECVAHARGRLRFAHPHGSFHHHFIQQAKSTAPATAHHAPGSPSPGTCSSSKCGRVVRLAARGRPSGCAQPQLMASWYDPALLRRVRLKPCPVGVCAQVTALQRPATRATYVVARAAAQTVQAGTTDEFIEVSRAGCGCAIACS
jgi:hypothetical protein